MIELGGRLLDLLSQEIKCRKFFAPPRNRGIDEKIDIITVRVGRPEREDATSTEQTFGCDFIQDLLRVIEHFPGLFTHRRVFENRRVSSAQFPNMKKWRPIDVLPKIGNRRGNYASSDEIRLRRNVPAPIDRCPIRARLFKRD